MQRLNEVIKVTRFVEFLSNLSTGKGFESLLSVLYLFMKTYCLAIPSLDRFFTPAT